MLLLKKCVVARERQKLLEVKTNVLQTNQILLLKVNILQRYKTT